MLFRSFREYVKALGFWGLIVIAPIILDIIGVYQLASNNNDFTGVPSWVWFQIAFIFLLVIPFIAFHKLRLKLEENEKEIARLKSNRPEITTKIVKDNKDFYIEVLNIGESAEFEAQIEVVKGEILVPSLPLQYYPYWEKTNTSKVEIHKGQKERLRIASLEIDTYSRLFTYNLHYIEPNYKAVTSSHSTSWALGNSGDIKPIIQLRI
jgi:hypothetical protein